MAGSVQGPSFGGIYPQEMVKYTKQVLWPTEDGTLHVVRFLEKDIGGLKKIPTNILEQKIGDKLVTFSEEDLKRLGPEEKLGENAKKVAKLVMKAYQQQTKVKPHGLSSQQATALEQKESFAQRARQMGLSPRVEQKIVEVADEAIDTMSRSLSQMKPVILSREMTRVSVTDEQGKKLQIRLKIRHGKLYAEVRGYGSDAGTVSSVGIVKALAVFKKEAPERFALQRLMALTKRSMHPGNEPEVAEAEADFEAISTTLSLIEQFHIPRTAEMHTIKSENDKSFLWVPYRGDCAHFGLVDLPPADKYPDGKYTGQKLIDRLSCMYDIFCAEEGFLANEMVHGDLKPENFFIEEERAPTDDIEKLDKSGGLPAQAGALRARLGDFGTVKVMGDPIHTTTWKYAPPEAGPKTHATEKTEAYALGVCLQEMVYGRREEKGGYPGSREANLNDPIDRLIDGLKKGTILVSEGKNQLAAILTKNYQLELILRERTRQSSIPSRPPGGAAEETLSQEEKSTTLQQDFIPPPEIPPLPS